jgi:hypothetical protein
MGLPSLVPSLVLAPVRQSCYTTIIIVMTLEKIVITNFAEHSLIKFFIVLNTSRYLTHKGLNKTARPVLLVNVIGTLFSLRSVV